MSKRYYCAILTVAALGCTLWMGASEPGSALSHRGAPPVSPNAVAHETGVYAAVSYQDHNGLRNSVRASARKGFAAERYSASAQIPPRESESDVLMLPDGFTVTKIAEGLNFPTALTWDDEGNMFVAEAGGGLFPEQLAPIRIVQVEPERMVEVANLSEKGIDPSMVGLTWHDGAFYFTHRAQDLTGAVSRVSKDGEVELVFKGIIDSQAEHQINDIQMGPDGRMYVSVGPAGNAGVMGPSVAPWVMKSPGVHTTPCQDIVLIGKNFKTGNFLTEEEGDSVLTGAYKPFGVASEVGEVIPAVEKCGGSILTFDPENAEATIDWYAWGFRNLLGLAWDPQTGAMYAAENGYDVRGSRPVKDEIDATLRVEEGVWYGIPDFSASRRPLTEETFEVPDSLQAPIFINGEFIGKDLGFVIDHAASGLTPPDPSLVVGRHEINSSPSFLDVAPASWGDWAGHLFIAEWGDLAPPTNPLRGKEPAGFKVVRVDPSTGKLEPFLQNELPGPASRQGATGQGLDRPFNVKFGPDGAMYVVDYGVVTIDPSKAPPYAYEEGTGAIWKVEPARQEDVLTSFTVRVENVSTPGLLSTNRANGVVPLSPGAFVVFEGDDPAFTPGEMADTGTMLIAEDGFPAPRPFITEKTEVEILRDAENALEVGTFAAPGGMPDVPAIFPGEMATFTFTASEGQRLQIETMFVQSDDWFYAFGDGGLELFDGGEPISGDVTSQIALYDAGTEIDAPPGEGPTSPPGAVQKPVQDPMATDVGTDESVPIQLARDRHPSFPIPANSEVIRVTIMPSQAPPLADETSPMCEMVSVDPGPPTTLRVRVQDTGSGLATVDVLKDQNATVSVPAFTMGTNGEVVVIAEKVDQAKKAVVMLEVVDMAGNTTVCDPVVTTVSAQVPEAFELAQNYPNPFNPTTRIQFELAEQANVRLAIYDAMGREVALLASEPMEAGTYEVEWNGRDAAGRMLPSGVYLYRLEAGSFTEAKTMTLLK